MYSVFVHGLYSGLANQCKIKGTRKNSDYKSGHHHEACNEPILDNMYNQYAITHCPSLLLIADFLLLCPVLLIHTHLVYLESLIQKFYCGFFFPFLKFQYIIKQTVLLSPHKAD